MEIKLSMITKRLIVKTKGENDLLDITSELEETIAPLHVKNGIATLFVVGSTAALTTIEYEPGLIMDFPNMLERIAPKDAFYQHEEKWHDENGHSHVRASLIGPSLTVPIINGKMTLGTWQQIVLVEFDVRSRSREIVIQIID